MNKKIWIEKTKRKLINSGLDSYDILELIDELKFEIKSEFNEVNKNYKINTTFQNGF